MSEGITLLARTNPDPYLKTFSSALFGTASVNVSQKHGRLYHARAVNNGATKYFLQVHDLATAPVNGATRRWECVLPPNLDCDLFFESSGLELANGLSFAISTTPVTLTLAASNDCSLSCQYTTAAAASAT